jgi:hypothetical protein
MQLFFGRPPVHKALNEIKAVFSLALSFPQLAMNRTPATSDNPCVDLFAKSDCETGEIQQRKPYIEKVNFLRLRELADGKKVLNMCLDVYIFFGIPAVEK